MLHAACLAISAVMPQYTLSGAVRGYIVITLTLPGLCPARPRRCIVLDTVRTANLENAVDFTDINPKPMEEVAHKGGVSLSQRLFLPSAVL